MQDTMKYLCENVQGVILGYCQSDEISLVLVDYKKLNSSAFFDYEVQKVCSITSSMATMAFNKYFRQHAEYYIQDCAFEYETEGLCGEGTKEYNYCTILQKSIEKGAMFDSRCFNIPKEEVTNYIYWRQADASRNSIQMVGQANFSHKELKNKSCNDIQDMLMTQKGINWNDLPTYQKRGSCCIKKIYYVDRDGQEIIVNESNKDDATERSRWIIDREIPIFKGEGREYVERLINYF